MTTDIYSGGRWSAILNPPLRFLDIRYLYDVPRVIGEGRFGPAMEADLGSFARIDLSLASNAPGGFSIGRILDYARGFVRMLPPEALRGRVSFEVTHSGDLCNTRYMEGYAAVYRLLKVILGAFGVFSAFGGIDVGFHHVTAFSVYDLDVLEHNLIACRNVSCEPDFITLTVCPSAQAGGERNARMEELIYVINDCVDSVKRLYIMEPGGGALAQTKWPRAEPTAISGSSLSALASLAVPSAARRVRLHAAPS